MFPKYRIKVCVRRNGKKTIRVQRRIPFFLFFYENLNLCESMDEAEARIQRLKAYDDEAKDYNIVKCEVHNR